MSTKEILKELNKLPLARRLAVVKKTMASIRRSKQNDLSKAARTLAPYYKNDSDLTEFTALDFEEFYESR